MELTNASGVGTLTVSGLFSNEVVTLEFDEEIRHTRKGDKTVLHFKNYTGSVTLSRQPAVQEREERGGCTWLDEALKTNPVVQNSGSPIKNSQP